MTPSVQASSVSIVRTCSAVETGSAGEPARQFAGAVALGENRGDGADLRLVLRLPGSGGIGHQDGQTSANTIRASSGQQQNPVSNGQMRARSAQRGIIAQRAHDRDPGQGLAADRAGIGELPAGLRPGHPAIDQPLLGEALAVMAAVMRRAEKGVRRRSPGIPRTETGRRKRAD